MSWGLLTAVGIGVVLLWPNGRPGVALADPEHDPARAETAFQEAVKLRNHGDLDRACPLFQASQRLDPAPGTLLNIAMCHEAQGRLAEAWASYRALADESTADGDHERLELASQALARLDAEVPRLRIEVPFDARQAGLSLRADRTPVAPELIGVPFPVDPGPHTITADAPGFASWHTSIEVHAGQVLQVVVPPLLPQPALPSLVPPALPDPPALPMARLDRPTPVWPARKKWAAAAGSAALIGLGLGSYLGFEAASDWSSAGDHCNQDRSLCDATGRSLVDDANRRATFSDIAFGAAVLAGAGAAVLWFTAPPPATPPRATWRVTPRAGAGFLALTLSGEFP